jgi:hypothetical protein
MKKIFLIGALLTLLVLGLGIASIAYAQSETPPYPGYGPGMMGGRGGGFGGMMGGRSGEYGPMHTYMIEAFAEALGLTPAELQSRRDAGETLWQIADSLGFSQEAFSQLWIDARTEALNKAVADGVITQEQADWMIQHMALRQGAGYGPGSGGCMGSGQGGGYRGGGQGRMGGRWTTP